MLFISINQCYSQKRNNIWCFGDSAGIDFNNITTPVPIQTSFDTRGSCVSIADSTGALLFYANTRASTPGNTTLVWNKDHQQMQNGNSIVGSGWFNELMVIPKPGDSEKYLLFSLGHTSAFGFYYSIIDMPLDSGRGQVIQKNILLNTYKAWDCMAGVKHANGRDWWIITRDYDDFNGDNNFHIYLITTDSIIERKIFIGASEFGNKGDMSFSKEGSKFLFISYNGVIEVMDFDRCSGLLSNVKIIDNNPGTPRYTGCCFSPNGNIIYVSTSDHIWNLFQYDLTAGNITLSKDTLVTVSFPPAAGGELRLAPDNKIYFTSAWFDGSTWNYPYQDTMYHTENMNLSVINDPDIVGSGCNLAMYSFYLGGKRTYWGLPNNPDYDLGPISGSPCDTLFNYIKSQEFESPKLFLSPNPAQDVLFINIMGIRDYKGSMEMYNNTGELIYSEKIYVYNGYASLDMDLSNFNTGIYFIRFSSGQQVLTRKFIKY